MARAGNAEQYDAISRVFDDLQSRLQIAKDALTKLNAEAPRSSGVDKVEAAMAFARDLCDRASDLQDYGGARTLIDGVNANLFLRFKEKRWGKRTVRKLNSGVLTMGSEQFPIEPYQGPTDKKSQIEVAASLAAQGGQETLPSSPSPGLEGDSLGNVNRGDKIRTCDLLDPNQAL